MTAKTAIRKTATRQPRQPSKKAIRARQRAKELGLETTRLLAPYWQTDTPATVAQALGHWRATLEDLHEAPVLAIAQASAIVDTLASRLADMAQGKTSASFALVAEEIHAAIARPVIERYGLGDWHGSHWLRPEKRLAVFLRDGFACIYCEDSAENGASLTLDHLIARADGGSNHASNLITSCLSCNARKGNVPWYTYVYTVLVASPDYSMARCDRIADVIADHTPLPLDLDAAKSLLAARKATKTLPACAMVDDTPAKPQKARKKTS